METLSSKVSDSESFSDLFLDGSGVFERYQIFSQIVVI